MHESDGAHEQRVGLQRRKRVRSCAAQLLVEDRIRHPRDQDIKESLLPTQYPINILPEAFTPNYAIRVRFRQLKRQRDLAATGAIIPGEDVIDAQVTTDLRKRHLTSTEDCRRQT